MKNRRLVRHMMATCVLTGLGLGIHGSAFARTEGETESADSADAGDIIVTAQRRNQFLREVPMSITAINAEGLEKAGVNETSDLARLVPGLTIGFYGANMSPALRGITATGGNLMSTSAVPLYLDGTYVASQMASVMTLPDVEQIEVLKGPQGALYGQDSTGGAIIVTTRAPSFTSGGKFSVSYGNFNAVNVRGYVTAPLNDSIAFSLAGDFMNRNGFRTNVVTGQHNIGTRSRTIRGKLLFRLSDSMKLTLNAFYMKYKDSSGYATQAQNNSSVGYAIAPTASKATSPDQFSTDPNVYGKSVVYGGGAKFDIETDAGTLNLIASYLHTKQYYLQDLDATPVNHDLFEAGNWPSRHYVVTADFTSRKFGRLSFNAGAFYMNTRNQAFDGAFEFFIPTVLPTPAGAPVAVSNNYSLENKKIAAFYLEGQYDLTDQLHLSAGGRYNKEWIHTVQNAFGVLNPTPPIILNESPFGEMSFSRFSPRATLRYDITPTSNVYGSFSRGFKGGHFTVTDVTIPPVKPETISAYEIGFKGRPIDPLTVTFAAFWYDYKNMQVLSYIPPKLFEQNAASARSRGLEFEATLRAIPDLTLSAGVSYLDAKFRKFTGAQVYSQNATATGNNSFVGVDLSGVRMLRSPKWSGNVSANYEHETAAGKFGVFAALALSSSYGLDVTQAVQTKGYARLDGEMSFAPSALQGLRFVAWAKNLNSTHYKVVATASNFASAIAYNDPRTFGIRAEFAF